MQRMGIGLAGKWRTACDRVDRDVAVHGRAITRPEARLPGGSPASGPSTARLPPSDDVHRRGVEGAPGDGQTE